MIDKEIAKFLATAVILNPLEYEWTIQGLGMLRLYVSDEYRLHIWNGEAAYPNVSKIHNHPWDFKSLIISGQLRNTRYLSTWRGRADMTVMRQRLRCGENCKLIGEPKEAYLRALKTETYYPGEVYAQNAWEAHISEPAPGCVTLIKRYPCLEPDYATVFYDPAQGWGTAEPRKATTTEIRSFCSLATANWCTTKKAYLRQHQPTLQEIKDGY